MTPAQEILRLIAALGSTDMNAAEVQPRLDEIDARVWCWLERATFLEVVYLPELSFFKFAHPEGPDTLRLSDCRYTRSRDALKAIRPAGWWFYANDRLSAKGQEGFEQFCAIDTRLPFKQGIQEKIDGQYCPTEELAELHAIIQAVEYDRSAAGKP